MKNKKLTSTEELNEKELIERKNEWLKIEIKNLRKIIKKKDEYLQVIQKERENEKEIVMLMLEKSLFDFNFHNEFKELQSEVKRLKNNQLNQLIKNSNQNKFITENDDEYTKRYNEAWACADLESEEKYYSQIEN